MFRCAPLWLLGWARGDRSDFRWPSIGDALFIVTYWTDKSVFLHLLYVPCPLLALLSYVTMDINYDWQKARLAKMDAPPPALPNPPKQAARSNLNVMAGTYNADPYLVIGDSAVKCQRRKSCSV